jgi:hypothetical protein
MIRQRCPPLYWKTRLVESSEETWRTADAARGAQSAGRFQAAATDWWKGRTSVRTQDQEGAVQQEPTVEPPGGRERLSGRNQPPDGTNAGVGPPGEERWPSGATG